MMQLPPGCTVNYAITIEIREMTRDIIDWYKLIGGTVVEDETWDHRGRRKVFEYVQYGQGKRCHYRADGTGGIRLHFRGEDAQVASMFIIKFMHVIENHNMSEQITRALEAQ